MIDLVVVHITLNFKEWIFDMHYIQADKVALVEMAGDQFADWIAHRVADHQDIFQVTAASIKLDFRCALLEEEVVVIVTFFPGCVARNIIGQISIFIAGISINRQLVRG